MAKSTYIGKKSLPSFEEMCQELFAWYAFAQRDTERFQYNLHWYNHANADCSTLAERYNLSLHTVCQVVAAISPGKQWGINIRDAEFIIQVWQSGVKDEKSRFAYLLERSYQTGYTWENTRNAFHILDTGEDIPVERQKTYAFASNLEFPDTSEEVTIDLHMGHVLGKTRKRGPVNVNAVYGLMVEAVRFVANVLRIHARRLQSAIWGSRVDAFEAGLDVDSVCDLVASIVEAEDYI